MLQNAHWTEFRTIQEGKLISQAGLVSWLRPSLTTTHGLHQWEYISCHDYPGKNVILIIIKVCLLLHSNILKSLCIAHCQETNICIELQIGHTIFFLIYIIVCFLFYCMFFFIKKTILNKVIISHIVPLHEKRWAPNLPVVLQFGIHSNYTQQITVFLWGYNGQAG